MPIRAVFWSLWCLGFFLGGYEVYHHTRGFEVIIFGAATWFLIGLLGWDSFGSPITSHKEDKNGGKT